MSQYIQGSHVQIRAVISAMLLTFATPALAEVNCSMVSALLRIHEAQNTLEQAATTPDPTATLGPLIVDLHRLNGQNVEYAMRDDITADDRAALSTFASVTSQFAALADVGDVQALRALIQSRETAKAFADATAALNRTVCDTPSTLTLSNNDGQSVAPLKHNIDTQHVTGPRAAQRNFLLSLIPFVAGIIVATLIALGTWFQLKRAELRRRRSKRYPANRPITYMYDDQNRNGQLLDISGLGAKIGHTGEINADHRRKVTLVFAGLPKTGGVVWSNENYAGVVFDQPLPRRVLQKFLDTPDTHQSDATK